MVHEDLNRVLDKPYVLRPEVKGADLLVSKFYLTMHLQRNQSIINDLFMGQYRNCLRCPEC